MSALAERLARQLCESGPMPFSSFMAAALYDADGGYYSATRPRTGREGDFFTSVSVGPVFGRILAGECCGAWERMGRPTRFTVIEAGANDGQLALDVLQWAREERPDFLAALRYQIDEPLESAARRQQETLGEFAGQVSHDALGAAAHGCYLANELLDAIPFRRVRFSRGVWQELHVGWAEGFCWVEKEPEDGALRRRLAWLGEDFPEGYTTEVAPAVASQVRIAADRLEQGYLYFADYGYAAADYYAPHRARGTLRCYRGHRAHEDPFEAVGETDLTAHVDFSLAARAAVEAGCAVMGWVDQARFLTGAAAEMLRGMEGQGRAGSAWQRQFQMLTHPAHLGQKFHFLVLGKGVSALPAPASLGFARPAAVAELLAERFPAS